MRWSADFHCNGFPQRDRKKFRPAFERLVKSHRSKKYKSMIYKGTYEIVSGEYSLDRWLPGGTWVTHGDSVRTQNRRRPLKKTSTTSEPRRHLNLRHGRLPNELSCENNPSRFTGAPETWHGTCRPRASIVTSITTGNNVGG